MNKRKVVLITGASSGIGQSIAEKFLSSGFKVVSISRTKPENDSITWFQADLTDKDQIRKAFNLFLESEKTIDVLINNAGIGHYGTWEETSEDDLRRVMELNFFSAVALLKISLPLLIKSKGTFITTSSVAGTFHVPCMGPYCASKYALNAFADSLRAELKTKGVHLLNLIVGRINTGFSSRSLGNRTPPQTPGSGSPEKLAEAVYKAYLKDKRELVYPGWYRVFKLVPKILPSLYDKLNIKKWKLT